MSRQHPVAVVANVQEWDKQKFEIRDCDSAPFGLWLGDMLIATCRNATALSNWALAKGAAVVRWDADAWARSER